MSVLSTPNVYDIGDVPEIWVKYTLPGTTTAVDPVTVAILLLDPLGGETSYTYGVDSSLVRVDVGYYAIQVAVSRSGLWQYRWVSTGAPGKAEEQGKLLVRKTDFYPGQ